MLRELREKRGRLATQMRDLLQKAEAEKRGLASEEQARYDELFADQEKLRQTIDRAERQAELDRELAAPIDRDEQRGRDDDDPDDSAEHRGEREERREGTGERRGRTTDDEGGRRPAADRTDRNGVSVEREVREGRYGVELRTARERHLASRDYRAAFHSWLRRGRAGSEVERRALQQGLDVDAGYLVTPVQVAQRILQRVDDILWVRQLASVETVANAASLGMVSLDSDPSDAIWTAEIETGDEDNALGFGRRELHPHPIAKRLKISNKLLRNAARDVESIALPRLARKLAEPQERAFLLGSGANQPLGVFTPSSDGIPTSRDVSTDMTTTAITADGLISAKFGLKPQYHGDPSTCWMFHRDAVMRITKLKDSNGQYIWLPGLAANQPDRILNIPMRMSEFCPNTFTTGRYVGILGAWRYYQIADALAMQMQRLAELYAEKNQTGFIIRAETDGQPVLAEAWVRLKLA